MNYQTVRLVSTFGSGSSVSRFGSSPKVETAAVSSFGLTQKWKLRTRFQFWAVSTFRPAQHVVYCYKSKCTMQWEEERIIKDVCILSSKLTSTTNTHIDSN